MTYYAELPRLSDGVVSLRPLTAPDFPRLIESCSTPEAVRFTTVPSPYSLVDAEMFLTNLVEGEWRTRDRAYWVIHVAGEYVGGVDLQRMRDVPHIGYLVHPDAWGKGYATRAVRLACQAAFQHLELPAVRWVAYHDNVGSRIVAERAGFTIECGLASAFNHRGTLVDVVTGVLLPRN